MDQDAESQLSRRLAEELRQACRRLTVEAYSDLGEGLNAPLIGDAITSIDGLVGELEGVLDREDFTGEAPPLEPGEIWSLGSITMQRNPREIWGGFVTPTLRLPLILESERVVAFLITLPEGDHLHRERHDAFGWHYHYLDSDERRSDVVLCWDVRAASAPRPIFQEKHGEGRKAFSARPDLWGLKKCQSMHAACLPDLAWPIGQFRAPTNKAKAVWPTGSVLTPRPMAPTSPTPRFPSKKKLRARRR